MAEAAALDSWLLAWGYLLLLATLDEVRGP